MFPSWWDFQKPGVRGGWGEGAPGVKMWGPQTREINKNPENPGQMGEMKNPVFPPGRVKTPPLFFKKGGFPQVKKKIFGRFWTRWAVKPPSPVDRAGETEKSGDKTRVGVGAKQTPGVKTEIRGKKRARRPGTGGVAKRGR